MTNSKDTFLVGMDGSDASMRAAREAARLAKAESARIILLNVVPWSDFEPIGLVEAQGRHAEREKEIERAKTEILEPAMEEIAGTAMDVSLAVRHGHIANIIREMVESDGVTHVFTGRRGRSKLEALLLGSVASSLVQVCPVPLTVVP